jgi:hypothetical protein
MSDHDQLERRLRAGRAPFDEISIAPDAWQENQRRLAVARVSRTWRWLTAAAVAVGVLVVGGLLLFGGSEPVSGPPASGGSDEVFDPANVLGQPVVAERLTVDGQELDHEIVLSDTDGNGPMLCDRLVAENFASGSCAAREPGADDRKVAFDWVTGSESDGDLRGVLAGVDGRVAFVDVWMSDGTRVPAELHPTGWEGTQMFAHTVPSDGPRPQRLVASGRDGNVLQAADLASRFGDTWLVSTRTFCDGTPTGRWPAGSPSAASGVTVSWSSTDALVMGGAPACLDPLRATALAGWTLVRDGLVVAVAPEVATVRVMAGEDLLAVLEPTESQGSPYKVAVYGDVAQDALRGAELVALDELNVELDREFVSQPKSP